MLVIGSKVNGYTIEAIENRTVLAFNHSTTCPERYVVWDLDCDGDGVNTGRYFNARDEAEVRYKELVSERMGVTKW